MRKTPRSLALRPLLAVIIRRVMVFVLALRYEIANEPRFLWSLPAHEDTFAVRIIVFVDVDYSVTAQLSAVAIVVLRRRRRRHPMLPLILLNTTSSFKA